MTEYEYLVDQITKHVKGILREATYGDSPFKHVSIGITWFDGEVPTIEYKYSKGKWDKLHRTPDEGRKEEKRSNRYRPF